MGLDIQICTDVDHELYKRPESFESLTERMNQHGLSRTFCNFMLRRHSCDQIPELDQIGRITNTDICPLYEMEEYKAEDDEGFQYHLEMADSEEERELLIKSVREKRESIEGNIERISSLLKSLIEQLSGIQNLHEILDDGGNDRLGYNDYFTGFDHDKGDGYIGNNFGQDLRNFKRFLEFAKLNGATTVYFTYG